ncbi:tRNA uridine-5-carboxymethylaminomethyl(34) synthesis GTPase MnmE [Caloramator proteoclasticus]|uniref:tRNA modification GTPase MnmE n=1 Tax=Caloramator proteoclasticus DSM 10124 TaxID=1121262 RepID=A0A1M4ZUH9_9CLOT|nr:tRNA uridine-5-carboxymethylaminomethyl(34) synthesis GTPase MnmE [Caloramator proteoclasticus]SHF21664.1 tRNA modification GTPase trmE [Caloramator proteoclasticus DSM 10124]
MFLDDTIAAISTPVGEGGIGIVRMSGKDSLSIIEKVFKSYKGKNVKDMKSYTMMYGFIIDPNTDEKIDEVIISYMKAPNTYTREDIVEINCHGGVVAVKRILSLVLKNGARLAEPGEFTKRAFLNGRIDLSQAEAVIDLIRAKTSESMHIALEQSQGKLSQRIKDIMNRLLGILAHIEASVDFPEDDIENVVSSKIINDSNEIIKELEHLIKNAETGKILREGLNTSIVGKPNVGKSSLLNALLEEKRAIVTDIPGTTRDVIEEYINIRGIPVKIIDTAGIRETQDIVEKIGVEKSKEYIEKSDLIIFMIDSSRPLDDEDLEIIELIKNKKVIVVINKIDLPMELNLDIIKSNFNEENIVFASINTEKGVEDIKQKIEDFVFSGEVKSKDIFVTNVRHKDILFKAKESILKGIETIELGLPLDIASVEYKDAYLKLGEITGDTAAEDIIDRIFSDFCIGK